MAAPCSTADQPLSAVPRCARVQSPHPMISRAAHCAIGETFIWLSRPMKPNMRTCGRFLKAAVPVELYQGRRGTPVAALIGLNTEDDHERTRCDDNNRCLGWSRSR